MIVPDLNCDLGEHEPLDMTTQLMMLIDSANIACGGHAGNLESMQRCIALCMEHGVHIGAHPGVNAHGGRGEVTISASELFDLLDAQVLPFAKMVNSAGGRLHHIKLHGSLYHATDQDPQLAAAFGDWCADRLPGVCMYARSGGGTEVMAKARGLTCWSECFLDRAYESDGTLRSRNLNGAVFHDLEQLRDRLNLWQHKGIILAVDGSALSLACDTFCLHSDSPHALDFAQTARQFVLDGQRGEL